jgi:MFS family permease
MFVASHVSGISAVFPQIISELGIGVAKGQWILTAYTLSLSASLLTFGSLADDIGLLRVYIWGMALFGVSSGVCALASSAWALIMLRVAQGVGAAMVSATSVALVGNSVAKGRLGRAVGWQTGMTYLGLALGPVLAGFAVQRFGWRVLFGINMPAAALAISVASRAPKIERHGDSEIRPQVLRVLWPTVIWMSGVIAFMIALNTRTGRVLGAAWAVICASFFLRVDQRTSQPFLGSWMIRNRPFAAAAAGETAYYMCLYAIGFLVPLYLLHSHGFTTAQIGVFLGSQSAVRSVLAPVSGRMSDRFGASLPLWLGIVCLALAVCWLRGFGDQTTPAAICAALMLLGMGAGLFAPANSKVLLCASPAWKHGASIGILATARNMGMTLGVALAALLYSGFGGDHNTNDSLYAVREAFAVIAGIAILYAAVSIPVSADACKQRLLMARLAERERSS